MALAQINALIKLLEGHAYPKILKDVDYDKTGIEIEMLDKHCLLIRNGLDMNEQITLFQDIQSKDKSPKDAPKAMYPSPKTLVFDQNKVSIKYKSHQKSVYNEMVNKANDIINRNNMNINFDVELNKYQSITMSTIKYPSPNGHFAAHIDHDNSIVYLLSIGCTTNFMVKGPTMKDKKVFKFKSGDLLVFDASTKAAILHSVVNIDNSSSCPVELGNKFNVLQTNRFGVQCRVHF